MIVASLIVSLIGVLAAGVGALKAWHANPDAYRVERAGVHDRFQSTEGVEELVRDQRRAARWTLIGTVLQFASVLLMLFAIR